MTADDDEMEVEVEVAPEENWQGPMTLIRPPRHPAELTADRLVDHTDRYADHLTPAELAAINLTVMALAQIRAREQAARRAGIDHA